MFCLVKYIKIKKEGSSWRRWEEGGRAEGWQQTAQETFLAPCGSAEEQQKGSAAALIHRRLQEAWGTWDAMGCRRALHILRGRAYCAPAQIGDPEWVGIQLSIVLSLFSLKASEQWPAINKHAQRRNRLRGG